MPLLKVLQVAKRYDLGYKPEPEAPAFSFSEVVLLSNSHRQDACATKCVAYSIIRGNERISGINRVFGGTGFQPVR